MNWARFELHNQAPEEAFEAFACQLFEHWCRQEYGSQLREVCYVNGAGGDGGVEAYGTLSNGTIVGLQAKWFLTRMGKDQFSQIRKSIETATSVRPTIARYCVAIPRSLTDATARPSEKTERTRWAELKNAVTTKHPQLVIDLWDEQHLTDLLTSPDSEGINQYWFSHSYLTLDSLSALLSRAKESWLRPLYNPDIHCAGQIETALAERLGEPDYRRHLVQKLDELSLALDEAVDTLVRISRMSFFKKSSKNWPLVVEAGLEEVRNWLGLMKEFKYRIQCGSIAFKGSPQVSDQGLGAVVEHLQGLGEAAVGLSPTREPMNTLRNAIRAWQEFEGTVRKASSLQKPVLFIGPPGTGKTHGLAHAVQARLERSRPAILLRAQDIDPGLDWGTIMRQVLDLPSWSLSSILIALEAQAHLSDVLRIRSGEHHQGVELEPTRVLIAVDGLDESPAKQKWADRLGELTSILASFPRVVVACSVRTSYSDIWRGIPREVIDLQFLPDSGDVPTDKLFLEYCREFKINCTAAPLLRWAVRIPLAVKLFSEEYKGRTIERYQSEDVSLVTLIRKKLDRIEAEFRRREGYVWTEGQQVVHRALQGLAKACFVSRGPVGEQQAITAMLDAQNVANLLSTPQALHLLDVARDYGLVDVRVERDPGSIVTTRYVMPAYNVLTDFLLASSAVNELYPRVVAGETPQVPSMLVERPDALTLCCVMLGLRGIRLVDTELWKADLDAEQLDTLQLIVVSVLPHRDAVTYRNWVIKCLTSSRAGCLRVLSHLVIPVAREPAHPFGSQFIHQVLNRFSVASRDLFWSGPTDIVGPWDDQEQPTLNRLSLSADDPYWSTPLLLSWGLTTVDNRERRRIRLELAQWGASQVSELIHLLAITSKSNDLQMIEDLLVATFGAVCLTRDQSRLLSLANLISANFLDRTTPFYSNSCVVRQAARGIIERVFALGLPVPEEVLNSARRPPVPDDELLPLDLQAAQAKYDYYGPIDSDLAWYVIQGPIRDFFQTKGSSARKTPREGRVSLNDVPLRTLEAALDGRMGRLIDRAAGVIAKELERRKESREEISTFASIASALKTLDDLDELLCAAAPDVTAKFNMRKRRSKLRLNREAEHLLAEHAATNGLKQLTPTQFALGAIYAHMLTLGWNRDQFEGKPNGGKPGEVLGADVAITRAYPPATHGSRSAVGSFAEKYVWTGVHLLTGYLADRLPITSYTLPEARPPIELAWVSETVPNPASDIRAEDSEDDAGWLLWPNGSLIPPVSYRGKNQERFVNKWVKHASVPELKDWIVVPKTAVPSWAQAEDWVTLRAQISAIEPQSCGESILWLSSFVLDSKRPRTLCETSRRNLILDTRTGMNRGCRPENRRMATPTKPCGLRGIVTFRRTGRTVLSGITGRQCGSSGAHALQS